MATELTAYVHVCYIWGDIALVKIDLLKGPSFLHLTFSFKRRELGYYSSFPICPRRRKAIYLVGNSLNVLGSTALSAQRSCIRLCSMSLVFPCPLDIVCSLNLDIQLVGLFGSPTKLDTVNRQLKKKKR